jgi:5-methylthioadenosine/S-adenosylhomocysteine deaminase
MLVGRLRYRSRFLLAAHGSQIVERGCVVVDGERVRYAGPFDGSSEQGPFEETVDLGDSLVMAGFVNTHCHSAMSILRGVGNGLSLESWLRKRVWPLEDHIKEADMVYGDLLSLAEYVRSGITSFVDFYNVKPMVKALSKVDMRCTLSLAFLDLVPSMKDESWRRLGQIREYRSMVEREGLHKLALAIHSAYACSKEMLEAVAEAAEKESLMITGHLMESRSESEEVGKRFGTSSVVLLSRTGILRNRFLAAHGVHLSGQDISALARVGASVAHCPRSNSRLGVGVAPVPTMQRMGLNVALGTDGVGSSDSVDFFEEMRVAAYLQRSLHTDAGLLPPRELLAIATSHGAKAAGLKGGGRLRAGAPADFIAVAVDRPHLSPSMDLLSNVVFCCRPEDVVLTVSGGKATCRNGEVPGLDLESLTRKVREISSSLG